MANRRYKKSGNSKNLIGIIISIVTLIVIIAVIVMIIGNNNPTANNNSVSSVVSSIESSSAVSGTVSQNSSSKVSSIVSSAVSNVASKVNSVSDTVTLDPNFEKLLLVNGEKPLPENFDYEGNLVTIPDKYKNGQLNQIDKDIWPYMKAMIEAAWKDNVRLYVWSPYRSYATQEMLFNNQVQRMKNQGYKGKAAEDKAATVVARPGTSEHNTGLACDFNMASDAFENTEMYRWMTKNAENYGFVMRYSKEKQPITGVIHESWHWRFVGINHAKKMNELGYCLEEYVDYLNGNTQN